MYAKKIRFIGVDTHKLTHTAAIIDETLTLKGIVETQALPSYYPTFIKTIIFKSSGARLIFGLEDVRGFGASLFRFLRTERLDVREINPVETKRERAHKLNPDKSDPDDALDIANVLGRKWKILPPVHHDPLILALQQLNRQRDDLIHQLVSAKNRLHATLHQAYPGYQQFFPAPFHQGALAFWKKYPSPAHLKNVDQKTLTDFLLNVFTPRNSRKALPIILQRISGIDVPGHITAAYETIIPSIVNTIEKLQESIAAIEPKIEQLLLQSPYKLHTMEGVGIVSAAQIVAQVAPIERFASASKLARFIGIAPRKWGSAKYLRYRSSLRGRRSLHQTFYLMALSQIALNRNGKPRCQKARSYYLEKVKEGKSKSVALKCLQRRLVDIVYAMMKNKTEYDPNISKSKRN